MTIFITGATGYLGSYLVRDLLLGSQERLALLIRASSVEEAQRRLWRALQIHLDFEQFLELNARRLDIYLGDLTQPDLGLSESDLARVIATTSSIIHCAASLNRKSATTCFNVNLRGTLHTIKLARAINEDHGLRRFSYISTAAAAGKRQDELVPEPDMIDWNRSDYDPYARTKKFGEYMVRELLTTVPVTIFRPSTILGDSSRPPTTQFDMVRAFALFAKMSFLPFKNNIRLDIVPVDYVSKAILTIHQKEKPSFDDYNISSGPASLTYKEIVASVARGSKGHSKIFIPALEKPFRSLIRALTHTPRKWQINRMATIMSVFLPYIYYNTVFDNHHIVAELGESPTPFNVYAAQLLGFALEHKFRYPYQPWPEN
ncbi:SDR family oxidoreductase [candidate division CSSED10-310 bacterium]|uniref:SDR family oxidoreductase n=1 Tax=candidate division CSSED10-310 bacterium TaxID=2855610 RepID=A0ABV6YS95_UNCC1